MDCPSASPSQRRAGWLQVAGTRRCLAAVAVLGLLATAEAALSDLVRSNHNRNDGRARHQPDSLISYLHYPPPRSRHHPPSRYSQESSDWRGQGRWDPSANEQEDAQNFLSYGYDGGGGPILHYHFIASANRTEPPRYWTWNDHHHVTIDLTPGQAAHVTLPLPRGVRPDVPRLTDGASSLPSFYPVRVRLENLSQIEECHNPCPPPELLLHPPLGSVHVELRLPQPSCALPHNRSFSNSHDSLKVEIVEGPRDGALLSEGTHMTRMVVLTQGGSPIQVCTVRTKVKAWRCQPAPSAPTGGDVTCPKGNIWGSRCHFWCQEGRQLAGNPVTECLLGSSGPVWSSPTPVCRDPINNITGQMECPTLQPPLHGKVTCRDDGICVISCVEGYVLPTSLLPFRWLLCDQKTGSWNHSCTLSCVPAVVPFAPECKDLVIRTSSLPATVPPPIFQGASVHVSCSLEEINEYHTPVENVCQAADWERRTLGLCRYKVTALPTLENGKLKCKNLTTPHNGIVVCNNPNKCTVKCNEGFSFPPSFSLLMRGFVECNQSSGLWDFETEHNLRDLPNCLGEKSMTILRLPVQFQVGVANCSDYPALLVVMTFIRKELPKLYKELCRSGTVECKDVAFLCSADSKRGGNQTLNVTWTLKASFWPGYGDSEDVDLDVSPTPLLSKEFRAMAREKGGEILQDSISKGPKELGCLSAGYAVDPESQICVECASGTYEEGGRCHPCPANHFQDQKGSTKCIPCPRGSISIPGARLLEDCKVIRGKETPLKRKSRSECCKDGGDCSMEKCGCPPPYFGPACQYRPCKPSYSRHFCLNGSTCVHAAFGNKVACLCAPGFTGRRCHRRLTTTAKHHRYHLSTAEKSLHAM